MRAALFSTWRRARRWAFAGGLVATFSQLSCAQVETGWITEEPARVDGGMMLPDGDGAWHCFTGTATSEEQFLNHCTEAERIERPTNIPLATWDGKSPLP